MTESKTITKLRRAKAVGIMATCRPLCVDLFCGLGGWTKGFLAAGYDCVGFDIERHVYGEHRYPAQLVLQDVRTLDGAQFANATIIVASSPCQEFSYRAMPWKRARALGPPLLGMELFAQARRIQREACAAAGRYIPMVQENVRGAQKWVGRAAWHYGSYYLWGDVPALVPIAVGTTKVTTMGAGWYPPGHPKHVAGLAFNTHAERATKTLGHINQRDGHSHTRHLTNQAEHDAVKVGGDWFSDSRPGTLRSMSGGSTARKAASARIAKIPFALASHIAHVYRNGAPSPPDD